MNTSLPDLVDRVAANREVAHELVPVAFIPLVALCFFVIYLAVAYGIFGRRQELGLVALRGVTTARRWWLATGETGLMIVAGAPVGYLLGYASVSAVAFLRYGGAAVPLSRAALPYAALALAGSLLVALLGQRRAIGEPVVELLRGVPRGAGGWRPLVVEAVVVALAVGATIQLRTSTDGLRGVSLLVPGLVVVAVALVAARAFTPAAGAGRPPRSAPPAGSARAWPRSSWPAVRAASGCSSWSPSPPRCCPSWPSASPSPAPPGPTGPASSPAPRRCSPSTEPTYAACCTRPARSTRPAPGRWR